MEIKNLFQKLKTKQETPEHFFALELADDSIKTAVWTVLDGQTKVVKLGQSKTWDGQDQEALLTNVDQSISTASEGLNLEPSGIVFGLPESWLDNEDINPDKKKLLKFVCEQLDLKPLGYVITSNALIQYLKIEEGTPPSAIFLQLNSTEVNLSLVKLGKVIGSHIIGRSEDLGKDVEEGLSRFDKIDTLPSRMILYNGQSDFEEDRQQLTSYDWEDKLPFIHFPKVEALSPDISIKAVALAGGSEVAKSLGFSIKPHPRRLTEEPAQPSAAADLGFTDQDIALQQEPDRPLVEEPEAPPKTDQPLVEKTKPKLPLQLIKSFFSRLNFKAIRTPKALTLAGIGFLLLFIFLFLLYWYLPKAQVIIYVEPKTIQQDLELTISSQVSSFDPETKILPGQSVDISVEGSQTAPTTGTALIGDPATGNITIYNKTNDSKTFASGTTLVSPDNLAFTLDEDTTVASSSAAAEGITFGKAAAKVTAQSIGPEGNLSSGTDLSFSKFSQDDYSAKVSDGLSGGTAREVKAVSQKDQDSLLAKLAEELKLKAQEQLQANLGGDKALVDVADQEELISKSFNYDVGEEADSLKLDAKLEYTALSYNQKDLDLLLEQAIQEKIPDNFQLSASSQIDITPAELQPDDTAIIKVDFDAQLIPKLDFADIKKNLKGKFPYLIQDYLANLPNFIKADITIKPNLPKKLKTLPRVTKNILIEIKTIQP